VSSQRLDEALVARGLSQSRARARDQILRGTVAINGKPARKPSQSITHADVIEVADPAEHYVSRSALKLEHGLDHFKVAVSGVHALDIGASTGGFTQVLLERGAAHVTAVDVGHGQMAPELAHDVRVTLWEGLNARNLTHAQVHQDIRIIVCDVSFISLKLALNPVLSLVASSTELVALIKPQFEVGRDFVGKGGMVMDPVQHARACDEVVEYLHQQRWRLRGLVPSPIEGGDGNREFLVSAVKV
jgi:23S rRNA (cytidine1920-2'-O)/16S rRNA (cytidine1409-2'-O)-methyltransferase